MIKKEQNTQKMWDIYAMEILEEKKGKWTEEIFEIKITENFPNVITENVKL